MEDLIIICLLCLLVIIVEQQLPNDDEKILQKSALIEQAKNTNDPAVKQAAANAQVEINNILQEKKAEALKKQNEAAMKEAMLNEKVWGDFTVKQFFMVTVLLTTIFLMPFLFRYWKDF